MCRVGDIIIVNHFKNETGKDVSKHPFVIVSRKGGVIKSLAFDTVAVLMSSIKSEEHRKKQLSYGINFEIKKEHGPLKDSYIKENQLYCFQLDELDYFRVGSVDVDVFLELRKEIKEFAKQRKAKFILTNLKKQDDLDYAEELDLER